jgi:hypothetical protein
MAAVLFRVRIWLRRRAARAVVTAVVVGLVAGVAMGLATGTRRTSSAPDRYTEWAGGDPDFELIQLSGAPLTNQVAAIDGVASVMGMSFVTSFLLGPDGDMVFEPNPFAGDPRMAGTRVLEGRFTNADAPDEFTVNRAMADLLDDRYGSRIGDRFDITSFSQEQLDTNRAFDEGNPPEVPAFPAQLVGIVETPTDFEESAPAVYFSPSFIAAHPTVGIVQTLIDVTLEPGASQGEVTAAIQQLPDGAGAFPTQARIVSAESRRAVRFQATALWIVTAIGLLGALAVIVQVMSRAVSTSVTEASSLVGLGWRRRDLVLERSIEALIVSCVAVPLALTTSWLVSRPFPLGSLRTFEPEPGPMLDRTVAVVGAAVIVLAVLAGAVVATRSDRAHRPGRRSERAASGAPGSMPLSVGTHFALTGPTGAARTIASFGLGIVGMAGLVGAGVVATSLDTIVDSPSRWGVNYDYLFGNPYLETEADLVSPVVDLPGVAALSAVHIGSLTIDGRDTATLAVDAVKGGLLPTTLDGRAPSGADEIGLGAEVARHLDVGIGSDVSVAGVTGEVRSLHVVGIVATPDSAGAGAVVPFETYARLNPTASRNVLLVRVVPGTSAEVLDQISKANFSPPDAMPTPTSIWALRRVLPAPVVLAIVLTVLLAIGFAYVLATSVRARRRDLAVLRALGAQRSQLRTAVHWQATIVTALVVVPGAVIGIVAGRWIVQQLTDALGIVPGIDVPWAILAVGVVAAAALANLLAVLPARGASRTATRVLTRDS